MEMENVNVNIPRPTVREELASYVETYGRVVGEVRRVAAGHRQRWGLAHIVAYLRTMRGVEMLLGERTSDAPQADSSPPVAAMRVTYRGLIARGYTPQSIRHIREVGSLPWLVGAGVTIPGPVYSLAADEPPYARITGGTLGLRVYYCNNHTYWVF